VPSPRNGELELQSETTPALGVSAMNQNLMAQVSGIVLAAGMGTRMGRLKQLARLGGKPLLYHVLQTAREARLDDIIVVLGFDADQIVSEVSLEGIKVVVNPAYAKGTGGSIQLGLAHTAEGCQAAIILLADQPMILASTISKLATAYKKSKPPAVIPVFHGRRGNPVLLDRSLFERASQLRGDEGFRTVLSDLSNVVRVEVDDPGILLDIDTPKDLERCREHFRKRNIVLE
jgi:molybdenum cofactor cytidylyltransferase